MLVKANRFHGYLGLRGVYKRGSTVRSPLVSLRFTNNKNDRAYRVAVVVSRKVSKSAVVRNRIRRRIYETIRTSKNVPSGTDMIFTVHSERISQLDSSQLSKTIQDLIKKSTTN